MAIGLLFWLLTALCCLVAILLGGGAGRCGVGLFVAGAIGTHFAAKAQLDGWASPNLSLLFVDMAYFIGLYVLAVRSHRYWPIWSAGFALLGALTSLAVMLDQTTPARLYRALESVWSLPILLSMAVGSWLDHRKGA